MRLTFLMRAAVAACLFVSAPAWASHYLLTDADIFAEGELDAFIGVGLDDTSDLLARVATPDERDALAYETGIPAERLAEIAHMCELLQVEGVGPRAARLLMAAGVENVADLAARDANALLAVLLETNGGGTYTRVNPSLDHVTFWVIGAAQAPVHVEY